MRRLVGVVVGAVLVVPGAAAAADSHGVGSGIAPTAAGNSAHRWVAQQRAAFAEHPPAGFVPLVTPHGESGPVLLAHLLPAGRLTANDKPDVIDVRTLIEDVDHYQVAFVARDAATGHALWHKKYDLPEGEFVEGVMPERVGATGEPGLVLITDADTFSGDGSATYSLRLRALSGADGHEAWSRTFTGSTESDGTATDVPGTPAVLQRSSGSPDYLVDVTNVTPTEQTVVGDVVSGVDGAVTSLGDPVVSAARYPTESPILDVDGDGFDDVLVAVSGSAGYLEARDGVSGDPIWTKNIVTQRLQGITAIGPFSDSDTTDLAISPAIDSGQHHVTVIQGSTGDVVWKRKADMLIPIGKAGSTLKPAVLLATFTVKQTHSRVRGTYRYQAVGRSNHVIYHHATGVSGKPLGHHLGGGQGGAEGFGDAQPDGAEDLTYTIDLGAKVPSNTDTKEVRGFIDGRTGKARRTLHADSALLGYSAADGSLRKGAGTDLLRVGTAKPLRPVISAYRGTTLTRYYKRVVPGTGGFGSVSASGLRVTGHHCSDIALETTGHTHLLGILTAKAAPLWTVSFKHLQITGGTLSTDKPPNHFCLKG